MFRYSVSIVSLGIGVNTVRDCMAYTAYNNEWFMQQQSSGATKFLNVIQGNDIPVQMNGLTQWRHLVIKVYGEKAFEGWAMGGEHMRWWKLICIE